MPSSVSTLLRQVSFKLSHIRNRLNRNRRSPPNDLPITRSLFHHAHGRHLTRDETNTAYAEAQGDLETARAPIINSTTTITTSGSGPARARRWSWANSDDFNVARTTRNTSDESEEEREEWREDWDEIRMSLKEVAKARPMITIIREDEPEDKHDSGFCEYDYAAVLRALQVSRQEVRQETVGGSRTALEREIRKLEEAALQIEEEDEEDEEEEQRREVAVDSRGRTLRQAALAMSDDGEEEERKDEELLVSSSDRGSMRTNQGQVASGDVWW